MLRTKLCLGLLALAAISAAQPEQGNVRQQAEAFFSKIDAGINSGKTATLFQMFEKDYYNVDLEGRRMDLAGFKKAIMAWEKATRDMKSKTVVKNVQLQNQEAVVWTEQTMWWKAMRNGRWVQMKETSRWAEQLRWTDGGWKFSSSQQLMTNEPWSFKTNGQ